MTSVFTQTVHFILIFLCSKERRARPGNKAKKHKQDLAKMVEAQLAVESLGYLDTGEDEGDPDSGGYEEATDLLGKSGQHIVERICRNISNSVQ